MCPSGRGSPEATLSNRRNQCYFPLGRSASKPPPSPEWNPSIAWRTGRTSRRDSPNTPYVAHAKRTSALVWRTRAIAQRGNATRDTRVSADPPINTGAFATIPRPDSPEPSAGHTLTPAAESSLTKSPGHLTCGRIHRCRMNWVGRSKLSRDQT